MVLLSRILCDTATIHFYPPHYSTYENRRHTYMSWACAPEAPDSLGRSKNTADACVYYIAHIPAEAVDVVRDCRLSISDSRPLLFPDSAHFRVRVLAVDGSLWISHRKEKKSPSGKLPIRPVRPHRSGVIPGAVEPRFCVPSTFALPPFIPPCVDTSQSTSTTRADHSV